LVPSFLVIVIGSVLAALQASRFESWETRLLGLSFVAHIISAFVQVILTRAVYGGGDLFNYAAMGETLAMVLRIDFGEFAPEVIRMLFHGVPYLPVPMGSAGSSTGAMAALAGFMTFFTGGSTYTLCLIVAVGAYFGKVALYRAFCISFPTVLKVRLMVASMLIPSAVFWSSALLKEGVAILGVGYLVLGLVRIRRAAAADIFKVGLGALIVGLVKAYILFPLVLAAGVWFFLEGDGTRKRVVRPSHMFLGMAVAVGGVVALGALFPEYALDNLAEQAAAYQSTGQRVAGGSTYSLGAPADGTVSGQLEFVPLALLTALFRPVFFEVDSVLVAINALETTVLLFLTIRAFVRRGVVGTWTMVSESPILVFCGLFSLSFGVAVGLTTTNLGTLSRYRMPLVPFFWAMVLALDSKDFGRVINVRTAPAQKRPSSVHARLAARVMVP
jgi:hypothetical protein